MLEKHFESKLSSFFGYVMSAKQLMFFFNDFFFLSFFYCVIFFIGRSTLLVHVNAPNSNEYANERNIVNLFRFACVLRIMTEAGIPGSQHRPIVTLFVCL